MKKINLLIIAVATCLHLPAQENEGGSSVYQQQLEQLAAQEESEPEDDSYWQYLESRQRHRLNLNKAGEEELRELNMLTDLQIDHLLRYRQLLGNLVNIYELQAVPGWDIATIRQVLPFVTVNSETEIPAGWKSWFQNGERKTLLRFSQVLEKAKGYRQTDSGAHYAGSPLKMLVRHRYQYRDLLQYGFTAEKDAGEQFFKGGQPAGFDFYSFHLFLRKLGCIKALAVGDFVINFGQGLIQWQGQAFKKSAAVLNVKRQSAVLRPYTAAGEFNFHRGVALTLQCKKWQSTLFASVRKWDASLNGDIISSVQMSGLHRTTTELANKNRVKVFATGASIRYRGSRGAIGFNAIHYSFSIPFGPSGEPYDRYAIAGDHWYNASIDYSYTHANFHIYGEMATDKNFHTAMLHGLLVSAGPQLDISVVYRTISPAYQSVAGNAFTENSQPWNETGFYTGLSLRPAYAWRIDTYMDFYRFPWLKYRVDAPSRGYDYLLQITWTPNKQTGIYTRVKWESKGQNGPASESVLPVVEQVQRRNWRCQVSFDVTKEWSLQNRVDVLDYVASERKSGFLFFQDIKYAPANKPWKVALRLQYFESDDYDTRLYSFENSVMYSFSMPAFFNKGVRAYANLQYKWVIVPKKISCSFGLNISQSVYAAGTTVGSGQDELPGATKTELRFQVVVTH